MKTKDTHNERKRNVWKHNGKLQTKNQAKDMIMRHTHPRAHECEQASDFSRSVCDNSIQWRRKQEVVQTYSASRYDTNVGLDNGESWDNNRLISAIKVKYIAPNSQTKSHSENIELHRSKWHTNKISGDRWNKTKQEERNNGEYKCDMEEI